MRPVYMVSGGITKFAKAQPHKDFRLMVREAFEYALADLPGLTPEKIDGSVCSYFSDHFTRQVMAGAMVQDYLGLNPKPSRRVEGGGATGGICFQSAWEAVASGRHEVCLAMGFETMSRVNTWKGNEFIALASDTNFDYPLGGFYTGYYAMMVRRHMHEFGTSVEQMAKVAVKNHGNALHNPFAQSPAMLTVDEVRSAPMVATPLTILDCCTMSDGAAVAVLASEEAASALGGTPVRITGIGSGSDSMRLADRPHGEVLLLPHENPEEYEGLRFPGVHSFRGGREAARSAYQMAGVSDPGADLDFVELHDAFTSSEIQTCEDLGLCRYGEGGSYLDSGASFLPNLNYGLKFSGAERWRPVAVNPSGGLLACGHPIGATGLMQAVFAFWQLQGSLAKHLGNSMLQLPEPRRGLIHSHAGTGTTITVTIMERV